MRIFTSKCLQFVALTFLALIPLWASSADDPVAVPTGKSVAGLSQIEWSRAWWQWASSFDKSESPVADRSGERCQLKQSGSVWFLAGTYGSRRTIRTCTVPKGTYLFFPLINYVVYPRDPLSPPSCQAVTAEARAVTDGISSLILDINGRRISGLEQRRFATATCFDLAARADPPHQVFPAAANGYYVMLEPLRPGKYEVNFGGVLPSLSQAVTYQLTVE